MTGRQIKEAKEMLPGRTQVPWREWTPEQQRLDRELSCREMINSILLYHGEDGLKRDGFHYDVYLRSYVDELGAETVDRLCEEQVADFRKAVVFENVFVDGEGLPYNAIKWADELVDVFMSIAERDLSAEGPENGIGYTLPNGEYHIFAYVDFIDDEKVIVLEPNKVVDGAHEPLGGNTFIVAFEDKEGLRQGCDWCFSQFAFDKHGLDAVLTAARERSNAAQGLNGKCQGERELD